MKFIEGEAYDLHIEITGQRYFNNDWGVYTFNILDETLVSSNCRLCGEMQQLQVGHRYFFKGYFQVDKKWGEQFVPITLVAEIPSSENVKLAFLTGLTTENVAKEILKEYPDIINEVAQGLRQDLDYTKIKGLGKKSWDKLYGRIVENFAVAGLIGFLAPYGVTFKMIKQLLEHIPDPVELEKLLKRNPYLLTELKGISFGKADAIALKMNPDLIASPERCECFLQDYLKSVGESDGHTYVTKEELAAKVLDKIPECASSFEIVMETSDRIYKEGNCIGLAHYHDVESSVYEMLLRKTEEIPRITFTEDDIALAIAQSELEQGFKYVDTQIEAIKKTLNNNLAIISGAAGTGKSSIMRAVLQAYRNKHTAIKCCALSAMAAARITEATSELASTIHRMLGAEMGTPSCPPIMAGVVFVDEASMINAALFLNILQCITPQTKLIIVGDHKQLPPIGYGNIFTDVLFKLPEHLVSQLTEPMRQAKESGILVDANKIRVGESPVLGNVSAKLCHGNLKDMYYWFLNDSDKMFQHALSQYIKCAEEVGTDDVVLACPRKKDCQISTTKFNEAIQEHFLGNETEELVCNERVFKKGAKVMQVVNDYDRYVFNGDMGYIMSVEYDSYGKAIGCRIRFDNRTEDEYYDVSDMGDIELAYALTVHKLQGSGRHTIIGVLDMKHFRLLDNCMLYTLITRAKKRCYLLCNPEAFQQSIATDHNVRNTWLSKL